MQGAKENAKRRKCKVDVHLNYQFLLLSSALWLCNIGWLHCFQQSDGVQGAKEIAKRRKCKVDVHLDYQFPPITSSTEVICLFTTAACLHTVCAIVTLSTAKLRTHCELGSSST